MPPDPDNTLKSTKHQLRQKLKSLLKTLTIARQRASSQLLCQHIRTHLRAHPELKNIATFAALDGEPDLRELHTLLPNGQHTLCYPRTSGHPAGIMHFHPVAHPQELTPGQYRIPEPAAHTPTIDPKDIDLILVPALAYTPQGHRLGKGGGYYDRYLPKLTPDTQKLGILFTPQLIDTIPHEPHDHPIPYLLHA